jgi:hypothetical protein
LKSPFENLNIGDYIRANTCYQDSTFTTNHGFKGIVIGLSNTPIKFKNLTRSKFVVLLQDFSGDIGYPQIAFKKDIKVLQQNPYIDFIPTINNIENSHVYLYDSKPIKILSINKENKFIEIINLLDTLDIPISRYKDKVFTIIENDFNKLTRVEKFVYK